MISLRSTLTLTDREKLHLEDQGAVCGNLAHWFLAVAKLGRDRDPTFGPGRHALDSDVPALDDLTGP